MGLLTIKQYAEHVGVKGDVVRKYIKNNLITAVDERDFGGKLMIDPDVADKELAENKDIANEKRAPGRPVASPHAVSFAESKAAKEKVNAQLAQLKLEEQLGNLLPRKKLEIKFYEHAETLRKALLSLPDRLAPELAAMKNAHKVHAYLTEHLTEILETTSKGQLDKWISKNFGTKTN